MLVPHLNQSSVELHGINLIWYCKKFYSINVHTTIYTSMKLIYDKHNIWVVYVYNCTMPPRHNSNNPEIKITESIYPTHRRWMMYLTETQMFIDNEYRPNDTWCEMKGIWTHLIWKEVETRTSCVKHIIRWLIWNTDCPCTTIQHPNIEKCGFGLLECWWVPTPDH